jgi:hypothetical protein
VENVDSHRRESRRHGLYPGLCRREDGDVRLLGSKFEIVGNDSSRAEVLNISQHGFWLFVDGEEHFLSFEDFPWFRNAPTGCLFNVEFLHCQRFYWPELDVDLDLERIDHPERFPLVAVTKPVV